MIDQNIQLTIDGTPISVPQGTTILDAARDLDIDIPTLCYFAHTTANGVCRLCVVEVEGARTLQAACVVQPQEGAVIHTRSPKVVQARRILIEMLASTVDFSEAPELQEMVVEYNCHPERFAGGKKRQPPIIDDNPAYIRDYAQCVMCWRCVQVCADDAQFTYALNFSGRGFDTQIATFFDKPLTQTTCVFCGNCVAVCPTGALKSKREHLLEQGVAPEQIIEFTRLQGKRKRTKS
ncbi:MAG: (2Fe-2S)-binding protein [Anaerolineae bacterium]|nr:(2Fe-2S)-binding protein [Anaerolineae bacterium]